MDEQLTQAHHSAEFAADHLRRALAQADPVAALVLIGEAARLAQQVAALIAARADRG